MATNETINKAALDKSELLKLYTLMYKPRLIEERMLSLLRQGKLSKWFSGIGQEAISVGSTFALNSDDVILPMHRNLGVFTTRSIGLKRLFRQLMGKEGGFTAGRDRSFHFGTPDHHIVGMISHLAAMLPVADGFGLAFKLKAEKRVALAFTGDGSTSEGDFHEALNLAAVWQLPVIFIIENNGYGLSTPVSEQFICERLADRAIGYGIRGVQLDGNDVLAVYDTIKEAADRARRGEGPTLVEAMTFRMRGHEEASGTKYVPKEFFEAGKAKDPVRRFEKMLTGNGTLTAAAQEQIKSSLAAEIEEAIQDALDAEAPTSTIDRELASVYHPSAKISPATPTGPTSMKRYVDAVSDALRQKMSADETLLILGQDVAEYGGVFKITEGFSDAFGRARVRNTPIIESGAIGAALGLALEGFKPIVEMQFADFVTCGFNQIVNNLAKTYYRWNAAVNVTIRLPNGGGMGAGPFHSQTPEAWFFHVPGLKLVAPSTPYDAKGLLIASIEDPNPVLFFEHKGLYRSVRGEVPDEAYAIEIGQAEVKRQGTDLTIISYALGIHWALEVAEELAGEGVEIEVVDLRTLLPWDKATVLASVRKTGRAIVLHEANLTGGIGAEVAATISEESFEFLDAPVRRIASLDIPIPFSPQLEKDVYWPRTELPERVRALLSY